MDQPLLSSKPINSSRDINLELFQRVLLLVLNLKLIKWISLLPNKSSLKILKLSLENLEAKLMSASLCKPWVLETVNSSSSMTQTPPQARKLSSRREPSSITNLIPSLLSAGVLMRLPKPSTGLSETPMAPSGETKVTSRSKEAKMTLESRQT